jgi:tetratricopeptide (TPR) repeat protein
MADETLLNDVLPSALQSVVDKKLTAGEQVLMTLTGASGEGLVVTDRRVMILREQMPIVGVPTEIDCFDHAFEQIRSVDVAEVPGGGRLNLLLFTPPSSDEQATLYFPSYRMDRFETAAARLRLLGLPNSSPDVPASIADASGSLLGVILCDQCGFRIGIQSAFCTQCGAPQGKACGGCGCLVGPEAKFCSVCGVAATMARVPVCGACGSTVSPHHAFCTSCGQAQGAVCPTCGKVAAAGWACCAHCGNSLAPVSLPTEESEQPLGTLRSTGTRRMIRPNPAAEVHNQRGMSLYEQEEYAEAAAEFETALDLAPGTPLYHCNLGVVYAEMGNDDAALEEYETAVRIAPENPTAYLNLGYFHSERGRDVDARASWGKVVTLAPDSPEADDARQNLAESAG